MCLLCLAVPNLSKIGYILSNLLANQCKITFSIIVISLVCSFIRFFTLSLSLSFSCFFSRFKRLVVLRPLIWLCSDLMQFSYFNCWLATCNLTQSSKINLRRLKPFGMEDNEYMY